MRLWGRDSFKCQVPNIFRKLTETWFLPWNLNTGLAFPSLQLSFQHYTLSLRHRTVSVPAIISSGIGTFAQRSEATSLSHVLHRELFTLPLNYLWYTHRMEIISLLREMVWMWHVAVTQLSNPVFCYSSQIYRAVQVAFPAISDSWYA